MAITFENEKILFDDKYGTAKEIDCFLPVHLTIGGKENDLYKKDGSHNEQYYKWQFLYCFVSAGLCSKDFIGVEVSFDSDGNMMMRMSENMAMDMDSGELHFTSNWSDEEDD